MYGPAPRRPQTPIERVLGSIFLLGILGLCALGICNDFHPTKLAAPLILLFWLPLLALHELGHAVAAALLGWRVGAIVVGMGQPVTSFRIGTAVVEVRLLPLEGFVQCLPMRVRLPRLESALIYLAGPGVELLLAAGILVLAGPETLLSASVDYGVIAWQSLAVAATSQASLNLLPFAVAKQDQVLHSDGLGIIVSLFRPKSHYSRMVWRADKAEQPQATASRTAAGPPCGKSRTETAVASTPDWVEAKCEECGQTSRFATWKLGTVQACPQCQRSMDVGPVEDDGEWRQAGEETDR